ncbi:MULTISPECIES: glycosyltransferase family 117 protein [Chitinophagaceae]
MNFKRINNITGWVIGIFACIVYIMTSEAGGSLWDCGEFVSSCFKVQIPHPPGAPLFILLGRFFIILFGGDGMHAAKGVNVMSAVASGLSILFLFWSVTHFARRIVQGKSKIDELTSGQIWTIMGAGAIGALAYTFSDSFWYSAVEGEVYASSALCTAVAFWAILKWEHVADEPGADRWIVFISFLMGLSIGIHLLNLLTIPALVMVYYFRRKDQLDYVLIRKYFVRGILIAGGLAFVGGFIMANKDATDNVPMDSTYPGLMLVGTLVCIGILFLIERVNKNDKVKKINYGGAYIFFVLSVVILGVVQIGVIQETVKIAGSMDVTFVNKLGLPFFSGFTTFFILLGVAIWYCLRLANKKGLPNLRLAMWCLTFMLIGYSSYLTTMIRSNSDPSIDMFKVDNPISLAGYLGRDQYGDFPILYGQKFTARPVDIKYDDMKYQKGVDENGKDAYIPIGKAFHYIYMPEDKMVFPRVWNGSMDRGQADYYAQFLGIGKNQQTGAYEDGRPTFGDNIKFFIGYQNYYMFVRYFLWNYSGKQDDIQGRYIGNVRDGNWITGISFIDNFFYGDQSALPDSLKNNKAHNTMFALPLILGLIGLFFHLRRKGSDALVVFLLFFMTGFAIIIYLNQAGNEPRERDYAFAGATYAFAIWIGLGMLAVQEWLSKKASAKVALAASFLVCFFAVPVLMAQQEWDDHDRSKKELARDLAKDYLESCAPNAILFTFGDNDTYPLWYAQEVEGIRPDIRVINTSLLGIDWYINELRHKVNSSDAIDVIFSKSQIQGQKRDVVFYRPKDGIPQNQYYDLYDMMKNYVGSDDPAKMEQSQGGDMMNTYPVRNVSIPVDLNVVRQNGTVNADDSVSTSVNFQIAKSTLYKNDWAILNIIAANKWKRPIYFTSPYDELGFGQYLRRDGLTYRLVPVLNHDVQTETVNTAWMYDKAMNKFAFGSADVPGVYFDEENRRHLNTIRQAYATLGMDLATKGKKDDARKVLEKADKMMLQENFPYGMVSIGNQHNRLSMLFLQAALMADDKTLADKVYNSVKKDLQQQIRYYNALTGQNASNMDYDKQMSMQLLSMMDNMVKQYSEPKNPALEHGQVIQNDSGKAK